MTPRSTISDYVLRSLYRSLLRASSPFSPSTTNNNDTVKTTASIYASLLHRSGISHDWEECIHRLDRRRNARKKIVSDAAAAAAASGRRNDAQQQQQQQPIPRSWARNLSRSYADLQQEYQLRKEYFQQRYEVDYDDNIEWEEEEEEEEENEGAQKNEDGESLTWKMDKLMEHLDGGTSSYYRHHPETATTTINAHSQENTSYHHPYSTDDDPRNVLFRHLLREWCVGENTQEVGVSDGDDDNNSEEIKSSTSSSSSTLSASTEKLTHPWPRKWTPNEEGYYQHGRVKQVALMKFPSQILQGNYGSNYDRRLSVRDMIRREFRAPSVEERLRVENDSKVLLSKARYYPPSSYIDDDIRIQTAFYTLMELNRKLAWAEAIGLPPPSRSSSSSSSSSTSSLPSVQDEMKWKRLVQAAKGVSLFPRTTSLMSNKSQNSIQMKENDAGSIMSSLSSILQCGTYLIAHPLMTGYFAKSVIVILDHAEEEKEAEEEKVKTCKIKTGVEEADESESSDDGGGTYGLIINRLALQPETMETSNQRQQMEVMLRLQQQEIIRQKGEGKLVSHSDKDIADFSIPSSSATTHPNILRSISLLQAIKADSLPKTVQLAFGDAPIREGGPVNLSLQMIHRNSVTERDINDQVVGTENKSEGKASNNNIGGTILGYDHDRSKKDIQDAIYFGGDVMKASHAVLSGESDRDDFSFVIGAACWAPGQLKNEIERGCWLPFLGPATMALTGMCEHNELSISASKASNDSDDTLDNSKETTKLSLFPPRPSHPPAVALQEQKTGGHQTVSKRPVGDLWLSVMCALGEGEAILAQTMLDPNNVMHSLGDACDNFDRD